MSALRKCFGQPNPNPWIHPYCMKSFWFNIHLSKFSIFRVSINKLTIASPLFFFIKELLGYLNIVKTQAPVLFNKYIEILKNTETWEAVEVLLNELLVNYPVYYDAAIDFYNNVIIPYVTQLTEMLGEVLVLSDVGMKS